MPSREGGFKTLVRFLFKNWRLKLLSVLLALLLWLFVVATDRVPFEVRAKVVPPQGFEAVPSEVLVKGEVSERFNRAEILRCVKVRARPDGTLEPVLPFPPLFGEVEEVVPPKVELRPSDLR
ncbi:MAG: hypothetical protein GXO08_03210 [Aquificae bacterium]|nr:hypothetical protein [Aquificota bacterium]